MVQGFAGVQRRVTPFSARLLGPGSLFLAVVAGLVQAASLAWPGTGQANGGLQVGSLAVLVALLSRCVRAREGAWLGGLFAWAWLGGTFWWLFISMHVYGGLAAPLAAAAVAALAAFLALYYAAAGAVSVALMRRASGWMGGAWIFASAWTLAELARGSWFTGFPWGAGGYAHVDGVARLLAPWVGVYGTGAVMAWTAAALVWGWMSRTETVSGRSRLWRRTGGLLALCLGLAWAPAPRFSASSAALEVALLQGNIPQDEKFQPGSGVLTALDWYGAQIQQTDAALVVAPETALPVLPGQLPEGYWASLQRRFATGSQAALVGMPLGDLASGYTNSVVGLAPGLPVYEYHKHHLVPFGEFVPPLFRWFTEMMNIPLGDFNRGGVGQPSLTWRGQRLAPNICYEDLFGEELAARFVDPSAAPTVLVNVSNIGWFGDTVAIDQHLNISRLRALEFARPMVRATNTGATAVIDHQGQVQALLPRMSRGVLTATVQGRGLSADGGGWGLTPYAAWASRWGLAPLWGVVLLTLVWFWRRR